MVTGGNSRGGINHKHLIEWENMKPPNRPALYRYRCLAVGALGVPPTTRHSMGDPPLQIYPARTMGLAKGSFYMWVI